MQETTITYGSDFVLQQIFQFRETRNKPRYVVSESISKNKKYWNLRSECFLKQLYTILCRKKLNIYFVTPI